jgi:hypothetical protein
MLNHLVAKDLVVDTADLHVMVDWLMELFQLYVDTNLDDNEELNNNRIEMKIIMFFFVVVILENKRDDGITHLALETKNRINLRQSSIKNSLASG